MSAAETAERQTVERGWYVCPRCGGGRSKFINRVPGSGSHVRRLRACRTGDCTHRFATVEVVIDMTDMIVVVPRGAGEKFGHFLRSLSRLWAKDAAHG